MNLSFRTSTASFDVLRGRYFPGGPTPPEGMDTELMFKVRPRIFSYPTRENYTKSILLLKHLLLRSGITSVFKVFFSQQMSSPESVYGSLGDGRQRGREGEDLLQENRSASPAACWLEAGLRLDGGW